jgi:predicted signal transduction protein with EAL and GGDEF domain
MTKRSVNPLASERRVALDKRRRVAEMSPEDRQRALFTAEVTGLPNRRAFDEAGVASAVAMSDLDALKALNDRYGYDVGGMPSLGRRLGLCKKQVLKRITTRAMSSCVVATVSKSYGLVSNVPEASLGVVL